MLRNLSQRNIQKGIHEEQHQQSDMQRNRQWCQGVREMVLPFMTQLHVARRRLNLPLHMCIRTIRGLANLRLRKVPASASKVRRRSIHLNLLLGRFSITESKCNAVSMEARNVTSNYT